MSTSRADFPTFHIPVVHKDVCNAQASHQEAGRPLCLETDGDHHTGTQPDKGNQKTENAELPLEDESNEQEHEKHSTSQLEADSK